MRYFMVKSKSLKGLQNKTNSYITEGCVPMGGVVKYEEHSKEPFPAIEAEYDSTKYSFTTLTTATPVFAQAMVQPLYGAEWKKMSENCIHHYDGQCCFYGRNQRACMEAGCPVKYGNI